MERYTSLDKSRILNFKARIGEASVSKILTFTNSDGTPYDISGLNFKFVVTTNPLLPFSVFDLTIGDGLTIQGTGNSQLKVDISKARAPLFRVTYFCRLYSIAEDHTWLNGDLEFHNGKYDGVIETGSLTVIASAGVVNITITGGSGGTGSLSITDWDGSTNLAPTGSAKGNMYRNTANTTTLLGPDGGIIPAGNILIALVNNAGVNVYDKTQWSIIAGVWGDYVPPVSAPIGVIYDKSSWNDLSDFNVIGNFFNVVNNKIVLTSDGGNGYLELKHISCLEDWKGTIDWTQVGTDTPFSSGAHSQNPVSTLSVFAVASRASISDPVAAVIYDTFAMSVTSAGTLPFNPGENYRLEIRWNNDVGHICTLYRITDINNPVTVTSVIQYKNPGTGFSNNTFRFAVRTAGTPIINRFKFESAAYNYPEKLLISDSIGWGAAAATPSGTPADRVARLQGMQIWAGPGDRTVEVLLRMPELVNYIKPKKVYMWIGINDRAGGASVADIMVNYALIKNQIETTGATVVFMTPCATNTVDLTSLKNAILAAYPNALDLFTLTKGAGTGLNPIYDVGDGTHLNGLANLAISNFITASGL